jgi:hypothetical protein
MGFDRRLLAWFSLGLAASLVGAGTTWLLRSSDSTDTAPGSAQSPVMDPMRPFTLSPRPQESLRVTNTPQLAEFVEALSRIQPSKGDSVRAAELCHTCKNLFEPDDHFRSPLAAELTRGLAERDILYLNILNSLFEAIPDPALQALLLRTFVSSPLQYRPDRRDSAADDKSIKDLLAYLKRFSGYVASLPVEDLCHALAPNPPDGLHSDLGLLLAAELFARKPHPCLKALLSPHATDSTSDNFLRVFIMLSLAGELGLDLDLLRNAGGTLTRSENFFIAEMGLELLDARLAVQLFIDRLSQPSTYSYVYAIPNIITQYARSEVGAHGLTSLGAVLVDELSTTDDPLRVKIIAAALFALPKGRLPQSSLDAIQAYLEKPASGLGFATARANLAGQLVKNGDMTDWLSLLRGASKIDDVGVASQAFMAFALIAEREQLPAAILNELVALAAHTLGRGCNVTTSGAVESIARLTVAAQLTSLDKYWKSIEVSSDPVCREAAQKALRRP